MQQFWATENYKLERVTRWHSHGRCVFIEDDMILKYLGSWYTLLKSIQKLINLDCLNIDTTDDSQQRTLVPAARGLTFFDTIGKSIAHILTV